MPNVNELRNMNNVLSIEVFDHDGDATGAIAFVVDGFPIFATEFAGAFFDGVGDGALEHGGGLGFFDDVAEGEVVARVATVLGGDGDFACNFRPGLAALGVVGTLGALDLGPV